MTFLKRCAVFLVLFALSAFASARAEWLPGDWSVSGGGPTSNLFSVSAPQMPSLLSLAPAPLTEPGGKPYESLDDFLVRGEGGALKFSSTFKAGRVNLSMKGECRPFHGDGIYFSLVFVPHRDVSGLWIAFDFPLAPFAGKSFSTNGSYTGSLPERPNLERSLSSLVLAEGYPEQISLRFASRLPALLRAEPGSSGKLRLYLDLTKGGVVRADMPVFLTGRLSSRDMPPRPYCSLFHVFSKEPFLRYRPFEAAFQFLGLDVENPYDTDSFPLRAAAQDEFGQITPFRPFYCRPWVLDSEKPAPASPPFFLLRFTPRNPGDYSLVVSLGEGRERFLSAPLRFTCLDAPGGFVIPSPADSRYLSLSSGEPYFPVGLNLAWLKNASPDEYKKMLKRMAAAGINCTRIWISTWGISAFDSSAPFGFNQMELALLDEIFELCDELNMKVILVLLNHKDLKDNISSLPFFKKSSSLDEFFKGGASRNAFSVAVRYLTDRFSAWSSLLAFETGNELDYVAPKGTLAPWTAYVAGLIHSRDPNRHIVTSSLGFNAFDADFWRSSACDLFQFHAYTRDLAFLEHDYERSALGMVDYAASKLLPLGKPALIAEFGYAVTEDNPGFNSVDTGGVHLHNALWASLTAGLAGSSMNWWWDSHVFKYGLLYHYKALSRFVRGVDFPAEHFEADSRDEGDLLVRELRGRSMRLGWVTAHDNTWVGLASGEASKPRKGRMITLEGFRRGLYRIEWWDTRAGTVIGSFETPVDGMLRLSVPEFTRDIAFKALALRIED